VTIVEGGRETEKCCIDRTSEGGADAERDFVVTRKCVGEDLALFFTQRSQKRITYVVVLGTEIVVSLGRKTFTLVLRTKE
jgi:hypothetical protein